MPSIVFDSQAMATLADIKHRHNRRIMRYMEAARRLARPVTAPTTILAELYRGPGRNAMIDACLAREEQALKLRDTDCDLARFVGSVLSTAECGSEHLADAHVVATAVEAGGGVIVTSDDGDIEHLAAPYRFITIDSL